MSKFEEVKYVKQVAVLPEQGAIHVQWATAIKKDGVTISETFERCAYDADLKGFDVAVGKLDVNAFLKAFNVATLNETTAARAALDSAEKTLIEKIEKHAEALDAAERVLAKKTNECTEALAALDAAGQALVQKNEQHAEELVKKDKEIAGLQKLAMDLGKALKAAQKP